MTEALSDDDLTLLDAIVAVTIEPVDPSAALRDRILGVVRDTPQNTRTVREHEGHWLRLVPGVTVKELSVDDERGTATILMTLAPGSRVAGHDHSGPEDSFVVSGSCHIGPTYLSKGDFHHADAGTHHGEIVSEEGCVLLLVVDRADYLAA
ncbi:MAG: cupin domain-containing protein [Acidobacteriota bacterium]|nr:cupin domain-containing protein [Acidobacteriota bacterium]